MLLLAQTTGDVVLIHETDGSSRRLISHITHTHTHTVIHTHTHRGWVGPGWTCHDGQLVLNDLLQSSLWVCVSRRGLAKPAIDPHGPSRLLIKWGGHWGGQKRHLKVSQVTSVTAGHSQSAQGSAAAGANLHLLPWNSFPPRSSISPWGWFVKHYWWLLPAAEAHWATPELVTALREVGCLDWRPRAENCHTK